MDSLLERKIDIAIKSEQVRRLEAELELEKIKSNSGGNAFSESESADYEYVFSKLNRFEQFKIEISIREQIGDGKQLGKISQNIDIYEVNLSTLIPFISSSSDYVFYTHMVSEVIIEQLYPKNSQRDKTIECNEFPNLSNELLMYGLLARVRKPQLQNESSYLSRRYKYYELIFTEKMEKFKYWMAFHRKCLLK